MMSRSVAGIVSGRLPRGLLLSAWAAAVWGGCSPRRDVSGSRGDSGDEGLAGGDAGELELGQAESAGRTDSAPSCDPRFRLYHRRSRRQPCLR